MTGIEKIIHYVGENLDFIWMPLGGALIAIAILALLGWILFDFLTYEVYDKDGKPK